MCDIDKEEEPTYSIDDFGTYRPFADTQAALYALSDFYDQIVLLAIGEEVQEKIRAELFAMLDALKAIITDPNDLRAVINHMHAANHLHELAEEAMLLMDDYHTQEEAASVSHQS